MSETKKIIRVKLPKKIAAAPMPAGPAPAALAPAAAAAFTKQTFRKDILTNLLANKHLPGDRLFALIMEENEETQPTDSRKGFLFEALSILLILAKCVAGLTYTSVCAGQLQTLRTIHTILELLDGKISGGNNPADLCLKQSDGDSSKEEDTLVPVSIKYKNKYAVTDVSLLYQTVESQHLSDSVKVALIVKDKLDYIKHKYNNEQNQLKLDHAKVIANNLLFDETDMVKALDVFCERYATNTMDTSAFIHHINETCLLTLRAQLVLKLHQRMTLLKFINEFKRGIHKIWCLAHKPRSGKSITLLEICKFLLETGACKRILIMTPVPATIKSFLDVLIHYVEFNAIAYKTQEEFMTLDKSYVGLVFCSVQYLKTDNLNKKKEQLKNLGFDAIITDESHHGSSTDKTKTEIFDADMDEIREQIRLKIFASGTPDKTKKYYKIHTSCVYTWEIEDEAYMKQFAKLAAAQQAGEQALAAAEQSAGAEQAEIIKIMVARHGPCFESCLRADPSSTQDYTKHPTHVLMKHRLDAGLIAAIEAYNSANGTAFGYNCASLFALMQEGVNAKGDIIYREEFALAQSADGIEILKSFFEHIISANRMKQNTMMKQVEATQHVYGSRLSTVDQPLMFIMYLPVNTRNGTINTLQKTIIKFLKTHQMWQQYNIEYSNALSNSNVVNEKEYNNEIAGYMAATRLQKKRGCILLLGKKGMVGITYPACDVTISLDEGHNLDTQRQCMARALTEAPGKTVGISVDMNIQRSYTYLMDLVQKHRNRTKTTLTNADIMYYLFKNNIFLFDPQEFNNGLATQREIVSYYEKEACEMLKQIDDTAVLANIICDDDLSELIMDSFKQEKNQAKRINRELEGDQQDCPKGDKQKTQVDGGSVSVSDGVSDGVSNEEAEELTEAEQHTILLLTNETLEMCKSFMFPLLALISRSYGIPDFKEIFVHMKTRDLIKSLLIDKKIDLKGDNYTNITIIMSTILDNNREIVDSIREIYYTAPAHKIRDLIAKHFIPTQDEKKEHAEVPTPVKLVDEMLAIVPAEFWQTPHKVFEPCCGKGNFVLGIFDKFDKGLAQLYPDNEERCRVILTECIYYGDITALNVFITTEILKFHVQSCCGLDELDYAFNHFTGDTLKLNIAEQLGVTGFEAIIGNPPYNDNTGNKGKGHTLWTQFIEKSLHTLLLPNGYLVFVHPSVWRQLDHPCLNLLKKRQLVYLEIHNVDDGQKMFRCATRYDWYLLQNTECYKNTLIKDEEGKLHELNLNEWNFIPNMMFAELKVLMNKENKLQILHSESAYEVRKKWMSHTKTEQHIHPCVYSVNKQNQLTFKWSETKDKGHFDICKFIFSNGAGFICDAKGAYGLTQWASGIVDTADHLPLIEQAFRSEKFNKIKTAIQLDSSAYNIKVMKLFSNDFWREFL